MIVRRDSAGELTPVNYGMLNTRNGRQRNIVVSDFEGVGLGLIPDLGTDLGQPEDWLAAVARTEHDHPRRLGPCVTSWWSGSTST